MSGDRSVALVTCAEYADGYPDDRLVVAPLGAMGIGTTFVSWGDAAVDWSRFDLAVLRSTWDYTARIDEFLTWIEVTAQHINLFNPVAAVRWSCDKRYLGDLARAGAPVVDTTFIGPDASAATLDSAIRVAAGSARRLVVKPSVGAGSIDTGRFESADDAAIEQAVKHAVTLLERGRTVMVQPYLEGIDASGETALVYLNGEFSHAIGKEAMLGDGLTEFDGLFAEERTAPTTATAAQLQAAESVFDAAPFERTAMLYARVDLLPGGDGRPLLLELELVEPSLFLADSPGAPERLASAIAMRCQPIERMMNSSP